MVFREAPFLKRSSKTALMKRSRPPSHLQHRYILEDVPYGLVPWKGGWAKHWGGCPCGDTGLIIDLASSIMERDFRAEGRKIHDFHILFSRKGGAKGNGGKGWFSQASS